MPETEKEWKHPAEDYKFCPCCGSRNIVARPMETMMDFNTTCPPMPAYLECKDCNICRTIELYYDAEHCEHCGNFVGEDLENCDYDRDGVYCDRCHKKIADLEDIGLTPADVED